MYHYFYYNIDLFQIEKGLFSKNNIKNTQMERIQYNQKGYQPFNNTSSQIITSLNSNIDELINKILQVQNQCSLEQPSNTHNIHQNNKFELNGQTNNRGSNEVKGTGMFSKSKKTQFSISTSGSSKENIYFHQVTNPKEQKIQYFKQKSFTMKKIPEQDSQEVKNENLFSSEQKTSKTNPFHPSLPKTLSSLFDNNIVRHVRQSKIVNENLFQDYSQGLLQSTIQSMSSSLIQSMPTQQQALNLKDFTLGSQIGSGKYGDVYRCCHKKTGCIFALKKIFKSTIKEYQMQNQLSLQIKILYKIDHPNIIKLYAHFDDEYHIFLLMEYAHGPQLMKKIKSNEQYISKTIDQVIDSVQYIHNNGIIHRDIKPENIIMAFQNTVKLCDFGWASIFNQKYMRTTFCGTLDYLSPQMKDIGRYTFTVDLWSIGILIYELFTGQAPFKEKLNGNKSKNKHARRFSHFNWNVVYPNEISGLAETFIRNLLKENPDERASLKYCKNHIFIKKYRQIKKFSQLQSLFGM